MHMQPKDLIDLKIEKTLYPLFGNLSEIIVEVNKKKISNKNIDDKEYAILLIQEIKKFIDKFAGEEMADKTYKELLRSFKFETGE